MRLLLAAATTTAAAAGAIAARARGSADFGAEGIASSTTAAEDSSGSTSASSSSGVFDTGLSPDFGDHQPLGCRGKIDFLSLISRLGTMRTEQEQLLASLPGFIDTIHFIECDAKIIQYLCVLGENHQRTSESGLSLIETALFMENDSEVIAGVDIITAQS